MLIIKLLASLAAFAGMISGQVARREKYWYDELAEDAIDAGACFSETWKKRKKS